MHKSCHWCDGPCFQAWKFKRRHANPELGCSFLKYKTVQYIIEVNNLVGQFFKKKEILVSDEYMHNQLLVEESNNPTHLFSEGMFLVQKGKKCWFLISLQSLPRLQCYEHAWRQCMAEIIIPILKHMVHSWHKVHIRNKMSLLLCLWSQTDDQIKSVFSCVILWFIRSGSLAILG